MKTNVFKGLFLASLVLFLQACSSEPEKAEKSDTQNKAPIDLNKFDLGAFSISSKYDSIVIIDSSEFSVPKGNYTELNCQLFETSDENPSSVGLYIWFTEKPWDVKLDEMAYGHFYTRYPEDTPLEFKKTSDTSYHIILEEKQHFDFRLSKNYYMVLSLDTLDNVDEQAISLLFN